MNYPKKYKFLELEKLAYERLSTGISIHQIQGNSFLTLLVSDGLCRLYERSRTEFITLLQNANYEDLHPEDRLLIAAFIKSIITDNNRDIDITYRLKVNKKYIFLHLDAQAMIMPDGTELIVVTHSCLNHYTQNKVTDVLIETVNENKRLVEELENAEKAAKIKQLFVSTLSHDMRTPMNAILGLSNLGLEEIKDKIALDYFKQIKNSADYLLHLINQVMDYQTIEAKGIILDEKPVSEKEFIDDIISIILPKAKAKGIKLKIDLPEGEGIYRFCDEMRSKQIVINVLNNAIKYTPSGGSVYWHGELLQKEGNFFECHTFKDTGVGISKEFLKKLFEPYTRETNPLSRTEGGNGLGLTITKRFLEAMNGKITCESKLGEGTTFYIELPMKIATKEQIELHLNPNKHLKNHCDTNLIGQSILVSEDNEINYKILSKILEKKGVIVGKAENGKEAIEKVKKTNYSILLMDIRMPVIDGLTATKEIRKFNKHIPIIALSGDIDPETVQKAKNAGMNDYITKPINNDELFKKLTALIQKNSTPTLESQAPIN